MNAQHTPEPKHTTAPWEWERIPEFEIEEVSDEARILAGTDVIAICPMVSCEEPAFMNAARIVACVNALAGVADPEAAIKEAREALREIIARYAALDAEMIAGQHSEPNGTLERARRALALLGGEK